MFRGGILALSAILLLGSPSGAAEKVVLRSADGRFLRATEDGTLKAGALVPGEQETFEIVSREKEQVAVKAPGGRRLVLDPGQTIELYDPRPLPAMLQIAVTAALGGLAAEELAGKSYDKTRTHRTQKHVDLPAFTLKDPLRMKRHTVLSVVEESRVQAQLDGQPDIRIPTMLFLAGRGEGARGLILLAVDARLKVHGRVQYKMPDVASVSTGYRTTVQVSAVAEIPVRRSGGDLSFSPPVVTDLHVSLSQLNLSNDLLEAARRQIEHLVNHELRHNEEQIRRKANQSLEKAMSKRDLRIPLLGWLALP